MTDHDPPTKEPIRFLFDYLSPYGYLAWTQVHALAERHGRTIEPVPVVLAALLDAHGQKGPAEIAAKRVYVFKNALRIAHRLGVPLVPPPNHPFNPLLALRASSLPLEPHVRRALIDRLFGATWGGVSRPTGGAGIEAPEVVSRLATEVGLDGAAIVADSTTPEAKDRLRRQTEAALGAGVFGVPTLLVGGELFFGYDSFPDVEQFLRGDDPVTDELIARWADLPSSAVRPRVRDAPTGGSR